MVSTDCSQSSPIFMSPPFVTFTGYVNPYKTWQIATPRWKGRTLAVFGKKTAEFGRRRVGSFCMRVSVYKGLKWAGCVYHFHRVWNYILLQTSAKRLFFLFLVLLATQIFWHSNTESKAKPCTLDMFASSAGAGSFCWAICGASSSKFSSGSCASPCTYAEVLSLQASETYFPRFSKMNKSWRYTIGYIIYIKNKKASVCNCLRIQGPSNFYLFQNEYCVKCSKVKLGSTWHFFSSPDSTETSSDQFSTISEGHRTHDSNKVTSRFPGTQLDMFNTQRNLYKTPPSLPRIPNPGRRIAVMERPKDQEKRNVFLLYQTGPFKGRNSLIFYPFCWAHTYTFSYIL